MISTSAARSIVGRPWYSVPTIFILSVCIGLSLTVFALVDGVLFKSLPYPESSELYRGFGGRENQNLAISARDLDDWGRAMPRAGFAGFRFSSVTIGAQRYVGAAVDRRFLDTLRVSPAIGGFTSDDFTSTGRIPVLVTHKVWKSLGGDAGDLSRGGDVPNVIVDPAVVVRGILPTSFVFPDDSSNVQVLLPLRIDPAEMVQPLRRSYQVVIRRPADVDHTAFALQLSSTVRALQLSYTSDPLERRSLFDRVALEPLTSYLGRRERPVFIAIAVGTSLLLLLAISNVTMLASTRVVDRLGEIALREALGARPGDIYRLLVVDVGLLVAVGSAVGFGFAFLLLGIIPKLIPPDLTLLAEPTLDLRGTLLLVGIGLGASLLVPLTLLRITRTTKLTSIIAANTMAPAVGPLRKSFVVIQQAATFILALAALLNLWSMVNLWNEDVGLPTKGLAYYAVDLGSGPSAERSRRAEEVLRQFRSQVGVVGAAIYDGPFLDNSIRGSAFALPKGAVVDGLTEMSPISSSFFAVTGQKLLAGRLPTDDELLKCTRIVMVSDRVARSYWPTANAVGQQLQGQVGTFSVVGVVAGLRLQAWDRPSNGEIYLPLPCLTISRRTSILVRSAGQSRDLSEMTGRGGGIRDVVVTPMQTMDERLLGTVRARVMRAVILGLLGLASFAIAIVGTFGCAAMSMARRLREIGVRSAVGGTFGDLIRDLLRKDFGLLFVGLLIGAVGGGALVGYLQPYLYKVDAFSLGPWLASAVLLVGAAATGLLVPLARAQKAGVMSLMRSN